MRKRVLLITLLVLVPVCTVLLTSVVPLLFFGTNHISRSQAFGWNNSALCYNAWGPNEAAIDRMIARLPFFPSIKEVDLAPIVKVNEATSLSDRLARLAKSPWIVSLDLSQVGVNDHDLASLANMSRLEWLCLASNSEVTDKGIAHLAKCARLRHLDLRGTSVTPGGIAALARCQELSYLAMPDCVVTDENVAMIPRFPKMTYLVFNGSALTEKGLDHFLTWHHLVTFGGNFTMSYESRIDFNKRFKAEWERAKAAGEDVPPAKRRGRPVYVPD